MTADAATALRLAERALAAAPEHISPSRAL